MKHLPLLPIILFLTACSSAGIMPTSAIATELSVVKTPVPENTKIATSPTPTEDPLATAPEGTTGFDENGVFYMDAENGNRYYYDQEREMFYWDAEDGYRYFFFGKTAEQEAYLARPLIKNYYAYDYRDFNAIPIDAWVKYGTPGAEKIVEMKNHEDVILSLDNQSALLARLNIPLRERLGKSDLEALKSGLNSAEGIKFNFIFNGETMTGHFGINDGYTATYASADELKALYEAGKAVKAFGNLGDLYLTVDGVKEGRILFRVASSVPLDRLLGNSPAGDPEYEFRFLFFWPLANLLVPDTDLITVNNLTRASTLAGDSALPLPQSGEQDLKIIIRP